MTDTYAQAVRLRCNTNDAYRLCLYAHAANQTEHHLITTLLTERGTSNFNHDNMGLLRRSSQMESMPLLVDLVTTYQAFDDAQRDVSVATIKPVGTLLVDIFDRFHPTFDLLREATLLELAIMAGDDRAEQWGLLLSSKHYQVFANIEPRLVDTLTMNNLWDTLLRRARALTADFNRTQQPVGFLKVVIKSRRRR